MNRSSAQQLIPETQSATEQELAERFLSEIVELEALLGVNLSSWKKHEDRPK